MIDIVSSTGVRARIHPRGATLHRLQVPHRGGLQDCTLLPPAGENPAYLGVIAGRYANRIADGRFTLDGQVWQLDWNEAGTTTLHGGAGGFSTRDWDLVAQTKDSVTLRLQSAHGDQGFPGNLTAECLYRVGDTGLTVELRAACDRPCPVNLTNHAYFNLDGLPTTAAHRLTIPSETYVPTDSRLIPLGHLAPVAGTAFDFRNAAPPARRIDATYVVAGDGLRPAARLVSLHSGLGMEVATTKPGVHLYDGFMLSPELHGHAPFAGLCLETHYYPDSPNHPAFPDSVLRPGGEYAHRTEFRFFDAGGG